MRGETAGTWSLWEARPDGSGPDLDFVALFLTDDGTVRPDLAERVWNTAAEGRIPLIGVEPLTVEARAKLDSAGTDFAYRAMQDLRPDGDWPAPAVTPRLIIKVVQ
ncbi:MAG TPA: hypothetical protein VK070_10490, partial [Acidimicrobiia bacterium]|nr:hypothetical protein [Acidimicrobiia bacterium]